MGSFQVALSNVLITLFFVFPGFILRKMGKAVPEHLPTLSAVLIYIGTPFLLVSAFLKLEFSWENLRNMGLFFLTSLVLQAAFLLILYLILHKKYADIRYRIFTVGSVMGNVGFFGIPIISSLFPEYPGISCYATMIMISMNMLVFTIGVFCLTGNTKYMSFKAALLNPTTFGFVIAFPVFLFGLGQYLPGSLVSAIHTVGSMTTPLCMFILGIRLASMPLKRVFGNPLVYLTALMKLVVFPLFCYAAVYFLPFDPYFKACMLILPATPTAAVVLSLAEMHRSDAELPANCILVSTLLCFITIPLLTLLL